MTDELAGKLADIVENNPRTLQNLIKTFKPPHDKSKLTNSSFVKNIDDYDKSEWIKLREKYASKLFILLSAEIIALFALILFIGLGFIVLDAWTLRMTIVSVTSHTFLLVIVIVKNLFPNK